MKLVCTDVINSGNLLLYPRMDTDSNADGVVDGFSSHADAEVTATFSLEASSQLIKITDATAAGAQAYVESAAQTATAGQAWAVGIDYDFFRVVGAAVAYLELAFYNDADALIATSGRVAISADGSGRAITAAASAPANTATVKARVGIETTAAGDKALLFARLMRLAQEETSAAFFEEYTLPEHTALTKEDLKWRSKRQERAGAHGDIDTGDGKYKGRDIEIEYMIQGKNAAAFRSGWDAFVGKAARQNQRLYVLDDDTRYLELAKVVGISKPYLNGYLNEWVDGTIVYSQEQAFYLADTKTVAIAADLADGNTFVLTNGGTAETWPLLIIYALQASADFTLTNITDNNRQMRYNDTSMAADAHIVLDCMQGTAKRGNVSMIRYVSGNYLRLLPGANTLRFDVVSGPGNIALLAVSREAFL